MYFKLAVFAVVVSAAPAVNAATPAIFFSDLTSGPNNGGANNKGAFVTIWGKNFGATRGTSVVTVGGAVDNYPVWTDGKISFQLGAGAASGNIFVKTSAGTSNGVPFTVRAGDIYFASTSGSDGNSGTFASPFATVVRCKNALGPGDICYLENGVQQKSVENYNAGLSIQSGGTTASPMALVAYPGATATIGTTSMQYAMRTPAISGTFNNWVISQLKIVSGNAAIDLVGVSGWRVVGNDMSCPPGSGQSACFHTDTTTSLAFLGNYVHDVGTTAGSIDKYYHAVYFTTNSNHIDVGWNTIVPNTTHSTSSGGCRAMQFYSTGGADQYDLHVHDNLIHDAICDGINFSTVDPSKGIVEAYNNVVYHVGTGPDPFDGSSNYACVNTGGGGNSSTPVDVYNNTFYDCGAQGSSDAAAFTTYIPTRIRNNVVYQLTSENYLGRNGVTPTGSNNVWFGAGAPPSGLSGSINTNPVLANIGGADFHLQSNSPAKDAGVSILTLRTDRDGILRPQGSAYDIGAYEFSSGGSTYSACDANQDGVVNSLDVQLTQPQILGTQPCASDLNGDGACTVVDLQRVINASLGQTCRVGP